MHNYIFDAATNGLLLQADDISPVACKEPRPVYAEEMDLLGFGRVFDYPRDTGLTADACALGLTYSTACALREET